MNSFTNYEEEEDDLTETTETPTIYRVQNIFEITCTETPLENNRIKKTIRATTTKLTERRRSNLFTNQILIEETPTPLINRKKKEKFHKYSVGKKKSKKPRTPVLRLPPHASGNSSGSKKIKKLLSKDGRINDENFDEKNSSPTQTSETPIKKASHIFKPKSKIGDNEDEDDNQGCDLSFDSLKKRERRQNQFVVRLSEVFSNIELEDEQEEEEKTSRSNKKTSSLGDIDSSPIVLQRSSLAHFGAAYTSHMESTKITSVVVSPSKASSNSFTHVTDDNQDMNETSRFEYTILNENGRVHVNEFNQLVILPTQYPTNNEQPIEEEEEENSELTRLNRTKTVLSDKTNNLIVKKKSNETQKSQSRYSYCTDVSIEDVTIPVDEASTDSSSSHTSVYSTASSRENLDLNQVNTKSNTNKATTSSRILFGNTQSPVVVSNKTSSFVRQKTINETRESTSTIETETNVVQIEQIVEVNTNENNLKKSKKLLQVNRFLNDDDSLPGSSNSQDRPIRKFSSIFKPKKPTVNLGNNKSKEKETSEHEIVPSASPIEEAPALSLNNSIVFNLTQQDLEFIFDSNEDGEQVNQQQRVISSRSSSKFSSTRNGSLIERTTAVTTTKAVAMTSKAVVPTLINNNNNNKQVNRKQPRPKKSNQVLLSHFNLNSFVDSLNTTFSMSTEKKYNIIFKIGEEIADHVCQLNDRQFYDKTKILCLIKELISKDINFIPSVLNPRLNFVSSNPGVPAVPARVQPNDESSSSDESDAEQAVSSLEQCNRCLQRNKLLTEVCVRCKLFYHKKCEKIRYIPVNGWICSACKTNSRR